MTSKQTDRNWSNELSVRLAGEDTRLSHVSSSQAGDFIAMNGLGTGVDSILVYMDRMMSKVPKDPTALVRTYPRVICGAPANTFVANFTARFVEASLLLVHDYNRFPGLP